MLYHISEEPGITRFDPRPASGYPDPVVWAVDDAHLRNYLLPRDCPRVTFFAGADTQPQDVERFLGSSTAVVAFEASWLDRVRNTRLFQYHLRDATFKCVDHCAGYFHSTQPVISQRVDLIEDLLTAIASRNVEIRILPSLWPLHDAVVVSTLSFSIIRMRNAIPRDAADSPPPAPQKARTL